MSAAMNGLSLRASHISGFAEVREKCNIDEHIAFEREERTIEENSLFKIANSQRKESTKQCRVLLQEKPKRDRKLLEIL